MSKNKHLALLMASMILIFSCKSQQVNSSSKADEKAATAKEGQTTSATKSVKQNQLISISEQNLSPNHARINATLIYINPVLMPGDTSNPCSKAPCKAKLRVNEVLGYGSSFGNPLSSGDTIYTTFMFTTHATTKDLFPAFKEFYPGVKVGDKIQTDLESRLGMGGGGSVSYFVYGYKILK